MYMKIAKEKVAEAKLKGNLLWLTVAAQGLPPSQSSVKHPNQPKKKPTWHQFSRSVLRMITLFSSGC